MPQVLILGGRGMLGKMIDRILSESDIITVKRTSRCNAYDDFYFEVEDGTEVLRQILMCHGPFDYVINCIGILRDAVDEEDSKSVRRAIIVNSLFPHDLATLAHETGAKVIQVSTDGVFSASSGICYEDSPVNCGDIYGKTKKLGEVIAPDFLILRCSIVGPDPIWKKGFLEWFLSQPQGAEVFGYTDHKWNGVTTLQFANLCRTLIEKGQFEEVRREGAIHHFCPNEVVSKYELLQLFKNVFKTDVMVKPSPCEGYSVDRVLDTRYFALKNLYGFSKPMENAIEELLTKM
ncbi:MAG: sugar nucleotide-binding protein [Nitrososphaerales archaeon]